jgi:dTDP-4-dehydrorhamnose 3,5-epimerase
MKFIPLELPGASLVEIERSEDERGFFARSFCEREFAAHGLPTHFPQCNISWNRAPLTLRGMHFQAAPHAEAKLVRCTAGRIHDVIVDLRPGSPTRLRWRAVELDAERRSALFIPAGFAHGFLTLEPATEVFYHMGEFYIPDSARGFRYDDPLFGIRWPAEPAVLSERDRGYPAFHPDRNDA